MIYFRKEIDEKNISSLYINLIKNIWAPFNSIDRLKKVSRQKQKMEKRYFSQQEKYQSKQRKKEQLLLDIRSLKRGISSSFHLHISPVRHFLSFTIQQLIKSIGALIHIKLHLNKSGIKISYWPLNLWRNKKDKIVLFGSTIMVIEKNVSRHKRFLSAEIFIALKVFFSDYSTLHRNDQGRI